MEMTGGRNRNLTPCSSSTPTLTRGKDSDVSDYSSVLPSTTQYAPLDDSVSGGNPS